MFRTLHAWCIYNAFCSIGKHHTYSLRTQLIGEEGLSLSCSLIPSTHGATSITDVINQESCSPHGTPGSLGADLNEALRSFTDRYRTLSLSVSRSYTQNLSIPSCIGDYSDVEQSQCVDSRVQNYKCKWKLGLTLFMGEKEKKKKKILPVSRFHAGWWRWLWQACHSGKHDILISACLYRVPRRQNPWKDTTGKI